MMSTFETNNYGELSQFLPSLLVTLVTLELIAEI